MSDATMQMPTQLDRIMSELNENLPSVLGQGRKKVLIEHKDFTIQIYWAGTIVRVDIKSQEKPGNSNDT